jgi:hypothetical protein
MAKQPKPSKRPNTLIGGLYDEIHIKEGMNAATNKARIWLGKKVREIGEPDRLAMVRSEVERHRMQQNIVIGKMYFFSYDPKYKNDPQVLPYYDLFPLIFPIAFYPDHFLGINLHYLSPKLRWMLLQKLKEESNNNKFDNSTKLRISHDILKAAANMQEFQPCLKMYLKKNVRSRFLYVEASEWDIAVYLPFERFVRMPKNKVWQISRTSI